MLNKQSDWFLYGKYWGTWNRVLVRMGREFPQQLEISLNGINNFMEDMLIPKLRLHMTSPDNRHVHDIPEGVYLNLKDAVGEDLANLIFHEKIIGNGGIIGEKELKIWALYEVLIPGGGGVPLVLLRPDLKPLMDGFIKCNNDKKRHFTGWVKNVTGIVLTPDNFSELHQWLLSRESKTRYTPINFGPL